MRGNGGNQDEKLGPKTILCSSKLTIPDTAGTTPDPAGNNTYTRFSKPNEASHTLNSQIRSYPPYHSHLHPPSLFLYHHRRTQR